MRAVTAALRRALEQRATSGMPTRRRSSRNYEQSPGRPPECGSAERARAEPPHAGLLMLAACARYCRRTTPPGVTRAKRCGRESILRLAPARRSRLSWHASSSSCSDSLCTKCCFFRKAIAGRRAHRSSPRTALPWTALRRALRWPRAPDECQMCFQSMIGWDAHRQHSVRIAADDAPAGIRAELAPWRWEMRRPSPRRRTLRRPAHCDIAFSARLMAAPGARKYGGVDHHPLGCRRSRCRRPGYREKAGAARRSRKRNRQRRAIRVLHLRQLRRRAMREFAVSWSRGAGEHWASMLAASKCWSLLRLVDELQAPVCAVLNLKRRFATGPTCCTSLGTPRKHEPAALSARRADGRCGHRGRIFEPAPAHRQSSSAFLADRG